MCLLRPARTRHRHRRERPGLVITIQSPTLLPGAPTAPVGLALPPFKGMTHAAIVPVCLTYHFKEPRSGPPARWRRS